MMFELSTNGDSLIISVEISQQNRNHEELSK